MHKSPGKQFLNLSLRATFLIALAMFATEREARAYADPGSGALIWQMLVAGLVGVGLKGYAMTVHPDNPLSPIHFHITDNPAISVLAFAMLAGSLYYFARKPLKK